MTTAGIKEVAALAGVVAPFISNWYYLNVIHGAEHALREAGYDLLLYNFGQMKGRERLFQHKLTMLPVRGRGMIY